MLSDDLMDSVGRSRLHVSRSTPSCRTWARSGLRRW